MGAKEAAVTKAKYYGKDLSHESVQSLGFNPFPFKTTKCSWDLKKLDSGKRKKGSPKKERQS